ncbi:unnamed protein product [Phytophthora lilii]|uniref:Unnamed protein product n=1 Tax=Phytophthora lilii TaxID=2077276 RepID=A0A9W6XCW1_9STRA|nr:unnamed protein product [Phytophthora lilii]
MAASSTSVTPAPARAVLSDVGDPGHGLHESDSQQRHLVGGLALLHPLRRLLDDGADSLEQHVGLEVALREHAERSAVLGAGGEVLTDDGGARSIGVRVVCGGLDAVQRDVGEVDVREVGDDGALDELRGSVDEHRECVVLPFAHDLGGLDRGVSFSTEGAVAVVDEVRTYVSGVGDADPHDDVVQLVLEQELGVALVVAADEEVGCAETGGVHGVECQHSAQFSGAAEKVECTHRRVDVAAVLSSFGRGVGEVGVWRSILAPLGDFALVPADGAALHGVVRRVDSFHDATDDHVEVLADESEDGDVVEKVSCGASGSSVCVRGVENDILFRVYSVVLGGELSEDFLMHELHDGVQVTMNKHHTLACIWIFDQERSCIQPTEDSGSAFVGARESHHDHFSCWPSDVALANPDVVSYNLLKDHITCQHQ